MSDLVTIDADASRVLTPRDFAPGIHHDISHADYLAIPALSSTSLKRLIRSAAHYRYALDNPDADDQTVSKSMGTALHMGILEPHRFDGGDVVTLPEDAPRRASITQRNAKTQGASTIASIDFWDRFDADNAGRTVLRPDEFRIVSGMVESVRRHPMYDDLFGHGSSEVTFQWRDARLGTECKSRLDHETPQFIVADVKSCRDASPDGFARAAASYGYHYQEAHYRSGYQHLRDRDPEAFLFVAVENVAPYCCAIYTLASNAIRFADDRIEAAMYLHANCLKIGYWPGYSKRITPVALPRYATTLQTIEVQHFQ